jgi:hypothetical protein
MWPYALMTTLPIAGELPGKQQGALPCPAIWWNVNSATACISR